MDQNYEKKSSRSVKRRTKQEVLGIRVDIMFNNNKENSNYFNNNKLFSFSTFTNHRTYTYCQRQCLPVYLYYYGHLSFIIMGNGHLKLKTKNPKSCIGWDLNRQPTHHNSSALHQCASDPQIPAQFNRTVPHASSELGPSLLLFLLYWTINSICIIHRYSRSENNVQRDNACMNDHVENLVF